MAVGIEEQSTTFNEFENLITVVIHSIQGRGMRDGEIGRASCRERV